MYQVPSVQMNSSPSIELASTVLPKFPPWLEGIECISLRTHFKSPAAPAYNAPGIVPGETQPSRALHPGELLLLPHYLHDGEMEAPAMPTSTGGIKNSSTTTTPASENTPEGQTIRKESASTSHRALLCWKSLNPKKAGA
ncbi:hypothetical protein Dda_1919 [Drechslerella dactyloides]|uniref:Uncharacterized protein n=1 Tax=Drechslerella dactyloides TaxID=74499 RepID=A0AAD6J6U7_DREDA|nr:hypothetical protein Dda_1919 [Drechslerella dactyloides]